MADAATFDVLATISSGVSYPEDVVTIYLDQNAAYHIHRLEQELARERDSKRTDALEAERKVLIDSVKKSQLSVHMRGLPTEVQKAIRDQIDSEFGIDNEAPEKDNARVLAMTAAHIVDITNGEGAVDSRIWDRESLQKFLDGIPGENTQRVLDKTLELTIKASYFENVETSPDFS